MNAYELKLKNISTILHWMGQNLTQDDYLTIDRDTLRSELDMPLNTVNRTLLILENQGVIVSKKNGHVKAYKLLYSLEGVTSEDVCTKIDAYNKASHERSQQKKLSNKPDLASVQLSIVDTNPDNLPLLPALPLTPGQLLMQQAQAMIEQERQQNQQPNDIDERLKTLEQKVDTILSIYQQASQVLVGQAAQEATKLAYEIASTESLPTALVAIGDEPVDLNTTRGKVVQIVNSFSVRRNVKHRNIWTWLYKKLHQGFNFSPGQHRQSEKERLLDVVERCNQLDNLYLIAKRLDSSNEG